MVYMIAVVIVTAVCLHYLVCVWGEGGKVIVWTYTACSLCQCIMTNKQHCVVSSFTAYLESHLLKGGISEQGHH